MQSWKQSLLDSSEINVCVCVCVWEFVCVRACVRVRDPTSIFEWSTT